jgi:hypothetical protein
MHKHRTLLVLLIVLLVASAATAQNAQVWLEPDTVYFQKRAYFYERVMCDANLTGAKALHLDITFDPDVAFAPEDSARLGSMFDGIDDDTVTVLFSHLWSDPSKLHLSVDIAYLRDSATVDGPGELLVLPMSPTGYGATDIVIEEALVFDRFNQQIPVDISGASWARICQFVGDVDADDDIDVADLVYLVQYMFQTGPEPIPSVWAANFNCDNSALDVSDLVAQVTWMFQSGPWLCEPPCVNEP